MVRKSFFNINISQFSDNFLVWISTLLFLPLALFFRFIIGTSLVLNKNLPAFTRTFWILGLVFIIWLVWKWIYDDRLITTGIEKYLGLFYLVTCLSTAFSVNSSISLEKLIGISAYLLGVYLLLDLKRSPILWQGIINALLITAGISSLLILITAYPWLKLYQITPVQILTNPIFVLKAIPRLPYSLGLHPSITAGYLLMILPLGIYQFIQSKNIFWKVLLAVGSFLNLIILFLTQSWGGLLGLTCLLIVIVTLYRKMIWDFLFQKKIWRLLAVTVLGLAGAGYVFLLGRSRGFSLNNSNIQIRFHLWKAAYRIIQENPWLGSGLGTFGQKYLEIRDPTIFAGTYIHAHNQLIQITTELGILGLISLLMIFWQVFRVIRRKSEELPPTSRVALIALGGLFGVLIPDAFFTSSMIVLLFIFYLVWLLPPQTDYPLTHKSRTFFLLSLSVLILGLGCSWIVWKIQPYDRALCEAENLNWQLVSEELTSALERDQNNPYLEHALGFSTGQIACQTGEGFANSISYYQQALQSYPNWGIDHANLAVLYAASGDYKTAAIQMELAIQDDPQYSFYNCLLGDYFQQLGKPEDALESYGICIANKPAYLDTPYWQEEQIRKELIPAVINQAENILNNEPDQTRLIQRAELHLIMGELEQANRLIQEFLLENPQDREGNLLHFRILDSAGDLSSAKETIEKLLILYPRSSDLWTFKGLLARQLDEEQAAESALSLSYRLNPSLKRTWMLGEYYQSQENIDAALNLFQEALSFSYPRIDFSYDVAGRWPIKGIYVDCMPASKTYREYFLPAIAAAQSLEAENCPLAACIYYGLTLTKPTTAEAQTRLEALPCYQEFRPDGCFVTPSE